MARKRSFREMRHENGSPITTIYARGKTSGSRVIWLKHQQNKRSVLKNTENTHKRFMPKLKIVHKYKCDWKFTATGNPKPRKRQKISHDTKHHSESETECKSKPSIETHNVPVPTPILHHCVLIERWNMLTSQHPDTSPPAPPNYPLLAILNERTPSNQPQSPREPATEKVPSITDHAFHHEAESVCNSNHIDYSHDTESVNSYETAYSYFDDDSVPTMSISDEHSQYSTASTLSQSVARSRSLHDTTNHLNDPNAMHYSSSHRPPYEQPTVTQTNSTFLTWQQQKHRMQTKSQSYSNYPRQACLTYPDAQNVNLRGSEQALNATSTTNERSKDCGDYLFQILKIVAFVSIFIMMASFQDINVIAILFAGYEFDFMQSRNCVLIAPIFTAMIFMCFRSKRVVNRDDDERAFRFKYDTNNMELPQSKHIPFQHVTINNFNFNFHGQ